MSENPIGIPVEKGTDYIRVMIGVEDPKTKIIHNYPSDKRYRISDIFRMGSGNTRIIPPWSKASYELIIEPIDPHKEVLVFRVLPLHPLEEWYAGMSGMPLQDAGDRIRGYVIATWNKAVDLYSRPYPEEGSKYPGVPGDTFVIEKFRGPDWMKGIRG